MRCCDSSLTSAFAIRRNFAARLPAPIFARVSTEGAALFFPCRPAEIFARCLGDSLWPSRFAEIFARVSGERTFPLFAADEAALAFASISGERLRSAAEILARVCALRFLPRFDAAVLAIASGDSLLPRFAAASFSLVSNDMGVARRAAWSFARFSAVSFLPMLEALSLVACSGESFLPRCAAPIRSRVSWDNPLTPSPPSVRLTKGPIPLSARPMAAIRALSYA